MFPFVSRKLRCCYSKEIGNLVKNFSTQKFETLKVSVPKPYVYHVELNRPEQVNAVNDLMWSEIYTCFKNIQNDPKCRVAVLSGAGKLFCAGKMNDSNAFAVKLTCFEKVVLTLCTLVAVVYVPEKHLAPKQKTLL